MNAKNHSASNGSYFRFNLVKRKFSIEFNRLRNSNTLNNSEFIIKLLMGMKYFRIKVLNYELNWLSIIIIIIIAIV